MRRLITLLGTLALTLAFMSGEASAEDNLIDVLPINMCEELSISPCPTELQNVAASSIEIIDLDNNCQGALANFGPTAAYSSDPVFGTYVVRAYVQSIQVECRKTRNLTATVENIPLTNTSYGSPHIEVTPCPNSTSCIASAGWARNDLFGIAPPICYMASAAATADTMAFGPYFAGTGGFACMPG